MSERVCIVCGVPYGEPHKEHCPKFEMSASPPCSTAEVELADVLAWADGVLGDLGTEHHSKVTTHEAVIANAIDSMNRRYQRSR